MAKLDERCNGSEHIVYFGIDSIICPQCGREVKIINGRIVEHLK